MSSYHPSFAIILNNSRALECDLGGLHCDGKNALEFPTNEGQSVTGCNHIAR